MEVRQVGRSAVDRWLRVARVPLDAVARFLPGNEESGSSATLFIDRADASLRATLGGLLHDDVMRDDAARRRAALAERVRAIEIRGVVAEAEEAAEARLGE